MRPRQDVRRHRPDGSPCRHRCRRAGAAGPRLAPRKLDAYDQRYYREWMHEIPPLRHVKRGSVLDVHHTILPPTSKPKPDARKLLEAAMPVEGLDEDSTCSRRPTWCCTARRTSSTTASWTTGLRDLVDLDDLLRHFGARRQLGFWPALVDACVRDAAGAAAALLRCATRSGSSGRRCPRRSTTRCESAGPNKLMRPVMDALFDRALMPDHATCSDWLTPTARWLLYVRAHYLRMPMRLLIPHLARKA